ncbi:MAG: sialate O-acetylesterase [Planctomycetota bacterium]|nr:sialate O-acetylesterase [Planctomycetota bacterium]
MEITEGLFDNMVLQRNGASVSEAAIHGTCTSEGEVMARVWRRGRILRGFDSRKVGRARHGRFEGLLKGLPAGGPYDIELRIPGRNDGRGGEPVESVTVRNVLVGDVWVLGGQSNMQGVGLLSKRLKPVPQVRAFYMTDEWDVAEDPLHTLWCAKDPVHGGDTKVPRKPPPVPTGVGPGVSFGQEMFRLTGIPQGLIACAHGGTSMSQWDPALKDRDGHSLYGAMLRRVRRNGGRVAGVVWYQGCSDATPEAAPYYTDRMVNLIRSMRRDLGDRELPVAAVQIGRVVWRAASQEVWWNSIQDQQRRLAGRIRRFALVPAVDLPLEDTIHISAEGQHVLGKRLARAMLALLEGREKDARPIGVRRASVERDPVSGKANVVVEFDNVSGRLRCGGRPGGFSLSKGNKPASIVYRTDLEGRKAILRTVLPPHEISSYRVYYGQGHDPYCNVTDDAGRPVPVFGPLFFGRPRALSDYVRKLRTSPILPPENMETLRYPADMGALRLETREFAGDFCDRHLEIGPAGACLVYFACRFKCAEAMRLRIHLGYDGPVKMWVDGKEVLYDPAGTNPARPDDALIPVDAQAGEHEALVALDSNGGRAWGIYLRFERLDVPRRLLERWPPTYAMPEILS